ncbi:phosphate acyltransferase PlsX [Gemelliphila palaticanis]|uniref:Phosphate acyltransferase n=1 Tax=Gemelliphila palaticanis TaxID=81950 RepID=A0ABX2T2S5_9BACL|nr:phosphate acyltransferase PlsX [Gemella palaticanis]MBF0715993.1 phosphate acyltransferase PlsX [Gemella palaticanis]NYS47923.1 phosphate acyltransferase PlsX [Gemella palaticanis]
MKIGIDLLGIDKKEEIYNFVNNFNDENVKLVVYGLDEDLLKIYDNTNVFKELCTEEVYMEDDAARVHRRKKDSSMIRMLEDLKNDKLDVTISGGSTGAYMASSLFVVGRIPGIAKPGLATMLPTITNHKFLFTDLGANVETKSEDLLNYSKLGRIYIENMFNVANPKTVLLNIGHEDTKGNKLYKETFKLLKENIVGFEGNLEARNILNHTSDVVIADGFTGNMVLKTIEGTALTFGKLIKELFLKNILSKISALLVKNGIKSFKRKFDYSEYGGAVLIGLKKPVIKIHGSANEKAVYYAVEQAKQIYNNKVYEKMNELSEGE